MMSLDPSKIWTWCPLWYKMYLCAVLSRQFSMLSPDCCNVWRRVCIWDPLTAATSCPQHPRPSLSGTWFPAESSPTGYRQTGTSLAGAAGMDGSVCHPLSHSKVVARYNVWNERITYIRTIVKKEWTKWFSWLLSHFSTKPYDVTLIEIGLVEKLN